MRPADWQTGVVTIATETPFVLLYDYRCPFAKNVHDHVIAALRSGLALDVTFTPYTLSQGHVEPGSPAVWDDPSQAAGLLALEASLAAQQVAPERFLDLHEALFAARHERSISLMTSGQIDAVLDEVGIDVAGLDTISAVVTEARFDASPVAPGQPVVVSWAPKDVHVLGR